MKQNFLLVSDKFKAEEIYIYIYLYLPISISHTHSTPSQKKWLEHNSVPRPHIQESNRLTHEVKLHFIFEL
jgi:hypothetical protein